MVNWVFKGLRTGIKTTAYPVRQDDTPGVSPGRPRATLLDSAAEMECLVELCPTQAIERQDGGVAIDHGRCVHCFRCWRDANDVSADWERGYEWAAYSADSAAAAQIWKRPSAPLCTFVLLTLAPAAPA